MPIPKRDDGLIVGSMSAIRADAANRAGRKAMAAGHCRACVHSAVCVAEGRRTFMSRWVTCRKCEQRLMGVAPLNDYVRPRSLLMGTTLKGNKPVHLTPGGGMSVSGEHYVTTTASLHLKDPPVCGFGPFGMPELKECPFCAPKVVDVGKGIVVGECVEYQVTLAPPVEKMLIIGGDCDPESRK